jgi:hypothetical protein
MKNLFSVLLLIISAVMVSGCATYTTGNTCHRVVIQNGNQKAFCFKNLPYSCYQLRLKNGCPCQSGAPNCDL